jgi:hyperosmotically inducible periplasmic protein
MKFPRLQIPALTAAVILSALALPLTTIAQSSTMPDNSKQNQTQNQTGTADNQSNAKSDRDTTAKVRKAIIADKNLSTDAHNVKIITTNGAVTLKGPVKSDAEKQQVASDAAGAVSADKITNELTVKQ